MPMKTWNELGPIAKVAITALGDVGPTVDPKRREVKGWADGEKVYYDSNDLRSIAAGLLEVADWLDQRAAE